MKYYFKNIVIEHDNLTVKTFSKKDNMLLNIEEFDNEQSARNELLLQIEILSKKRHSLN